MTLTRSDCLALDATDRLAAHRASFALPEGVIYLDGNSLGALPRATAARLAQVVDVEWGEGLIRSWTPPAGSTRRGVSARRSRR